MEKVLEALTPEQEMLMKTVVKDWVDLALFSGKDLKAEEIREDVDWVYSKIGLGPPKIKIAGSPYGQQIGINSYRTRGSHVLPHVMSQVKSQVWLQMESQVWSQLRSQVWSQIRSQVGLQVWSQVDSQVRSQVSSQVSSQVRSQVWPQVRSQGLTYFSQLFGLACDSGGLSFYDFFKRIGVVDNKDFSRYMDFYRKGVWEIGYFEKAAFISKLPTEVRRDSNNNLHSTEEPAVEWRDGYNNYFIHGVGFGEELWEEVAYRTMKPEEVLTLKNTEQRRAVLEVYGAGWVLENTKARLVDSSKRGNELYEVPGLFGNGLTAKMLKYTDPSTGEVYTSFVPSETQKADNGMAWKFRLTPEEYAELRNES